jgi:hypothetical protein
VWNALLKAEIIVVARNTAKNMKPNKPSDTYVNRVAQFEADERRKAAEAPTEISPTQLPSTSENPFIRARVDVLNKYNEFKRREIAEMEKTGNKENRVYQEFVAEVALAAERYY